MVLGFMTKFPYTGQPTNFESKILSGQKRFTLRRLGKRKYRVGMVLQMCTDVRTKAQKQFATSSVAGLGRVQIYSWGENVSVRSYIDGLWVTIEDQTLVDFSQADGFDSLADFRAYWTREYSKALLAGELDGLWLELQQIIWDVPLPTEALF
jgi:hypothetical protein